MLRRPVYARGVDRRSRAVRGGFARLGSPAGASPAGASLGYGRAQHERAAKPSVSDLLSAVLAELHRHGVQHDAGKADRRERLRNVEPDSAQLLSLLVKATHARRLLELGTSNGYSTLWLADAARSIGGRVVSLDVDAARSAQAAENLHRAGLREHVELRVQDAALGLRESSDAAWDMIFLDAERPAYAGYWPDLVRVLRPGGLLAVDNVLSHADQVGELRALISSDERVSEALAPTGAGVLLVVKNPTGPSGAA
jgi:predicted O-methyltransferase YrrM